MAEVVGEAADDVVVVIRVPRNHSKQRRKLNNTFLERDFNTDSVWQ